MTNATPTPAENPNLSAKWTAERLDALPEGTVIEWIIPGGQPLRYFIKDLGVADPDRPWVYTKGGVESSLDLLRMVAFKESLRVVSVPIDALLADETVYVAEDAFVEVTHMAGPNRNEAETVLRAAIAHVTGEATA